MFAVSLQFGLYQDITVGLQNSKVLVICVSDEVNKVTDYANVIITPGQRYNIKLYCQNIQIYLYELLEASSECK